MTTWQDRARTLTDQLAAEGVLAPGWREAFESTPRHVFVPEFYRRDDGALISGADRAQRDEWLAAVYSDDSLTTQRATVPGIDIAWPTSSSTMPSLMARMLTLLDVQDGQRVMEIGTGTGYNAALLCYRLGAANVTSIDIDPALVDAARDRLAELGYRPHLTAGDGALGIPALAPYDRIIATCAVPEVPPAWITQLRIGGSIVADVRGELASSLVVLHKANADTAVGAFLDVPGHFMWLRAEAGSPFRTPGTFGAQLDHSSTSTRTTTLDPAILDDPGFRFVLQLDEPGIKLPGTISYDNGPDRLLVQAEDGSWVEIDGNTVVEGGPRRLWAVIEGAVATWDKHGRPARDRFGITASINQPARYWVDSPDNDWR
ncbi:methyltransferase domain-containing protein [Longispora albida]|uniref:methyltransferase domain-containing protein n=1 Tax=Longispora albida TaxID=203523 RepID=UPI0003736B36|nr:methyltransferase domain-containing protein [Longispora albida]